MTVNDVVATAEIHARQLPHGYFAQLGPGFLAAYHRSFVESPHAVATVATLDGKVAGFLVGTLRTRAHYGGLLRRSGVLLLRRAVVGMLRRPRALVDLVRHRLGRYARALSRSLGRVGQDEDTGGRPAPARTVAVLTHVAVLAGAAGHGLGAELVRGFEDVVRAAGIPEIRLVTLAGEDGAASFYEGLGWQRLRERWGADGHRVVEFRRSL